jgi:hypothetical protein
VLGNRLLRGAAFGLLGCLLVYGAGCSSDAEPPAPAAEQPDLEGVVYLGDTTDEGLEVLLASETRAGAKPVLSSPADGAVLTAKTAFTFETGTTARFEAPCETGVRITSLRELFGPERLARAHGLPMNGAAFLLTFSTASEPHLLRVFTDDTTYEPDNLEWSTLAAAGNVTLTIRSGVFEEGRLSSGAGPFESGPFHFSISGS